MGTGYTRADTLNNIADGNIINASDIDSEYDAIESAFNESTGHTHDGTAAEGAPITVLGPVQDFIASATEIKPKTTNTLDIGTNSLQFKDMYLDGTAYIDSLGEDILVATDKKVQFRDTALFINSSADGQLDIDADVEVEITAPTLDIDASTAVSIDTATLTITGSANVVGDLDVDNINIDGNTIISTDTNGDINISPDGTGTVVIDTDLDIDNININGNTIISTNTNGNIALTPNGTGEVDISKVDIASGEIDGTTIGASSAAAITGTTITGTSFVSSGDMTFGDNDKAIFGAGSDLQIYHDGSNSVIKDNGAGDLRIMGSDDVRIVDAVNEENMARFNRDGAVTLYYDNAAKFATTSSGIDVTGTVTADGLTVDGDVDINATNTTLTSPQPRIWFIENDETDLSALIRNISGDFQINTVPNDKSGSTLRFNIDHTTGDISFYDDTGVTQGLFWDADQQRLGLGTTSPDSRLTVQSPDNTLATDIFKFTSLNGTAGLKFGYQRIEQISSSTPITFNTGGSERVRIDSSGNVLVGKTAAGLSTNGVELNANNFVYITRASATPFYVNRKTNDGNIIDFRKDGISVGSIGAVLGDAYIHTGNTGLRFYNVNSQIIPVTTGGANRDNAIDLGNSAVRFDDIYATNGTIQTSDQNEKQQIASLTDAEITAATAISKLFKTFKWNDSVAAKGDAARTHTGVIAQQVETAMTDAGLDAGDYAFFISTTWWETQTEVPAVEAVEAVYEDVVIPAVLDEDGNEVEAERTEQRTVTEAVEAVDAYTRTDTYDTAEEAPVGATERTRLGIRYPELLAFIGAATEQRLASIETRLDALENA